MKKVKKTLAVLLSVCMLLSGLVFSLPQAAAETYPDNLYNGTQAVIYNASAAQKGKYLVEIDAVKYNPNTSREPAAIQSEAGDIILTYRADNGTAPESTLRLEDVIAANAFNYVGEGTISYYAIVDGFPQKATISVKKTNMAANDSGLYAGIKVWNIGSGSFQALFDYSKIERSNGEGTGDLMFTSATVLAQYYPYAVSGSATGGNLTLPAGQNATSVAQGFYVIDQWGVTMMAPDIEYTPVTGLTFSQSKNVMTVKGTGDANNPNGARTVNLTATYKTLNTSVSNNYSLSKSFTVYNSSTLTYAPTFANREKAGLSISFTAGSSTVKRFELNSSYQTTTTNYVVLKNNASRAAHVNLSSTSSDKFSISPSEYTLSPGESKSFQLIDLRAASGNYNADITVNYTLEGLYDAATGMPASLNAGGTIPFVYRPSNTPSANVYDTDNYGSKVDSTIAYQSNAGVLEFVRKDESQNQSKLEANFYINTSEYPTYQSAGLGFYIRRNTTAHDYYFQHEDNHAGKHTLTGSYTSPGSFGFTSSPGTHELKNGSFKQEKVDVKVNNDTNTAFQAFYGTVFSCGTASPAQILFTGKDGSGNLNFNGNDDKDGLQMYCPGGFPYPANSAYLLTRLNVYAFNTASLTSGINTAVSTRFLSCYYNSTKWANYTSMSSSALRTAQIQQGTLVTNQANIDAANSALTAAYNTLRSSTSNGTYSLIHNKHTGDKMSAISASSVDYYVFETGASNVLKFNDAYASECNKHSNAVTPTLNASGTYEHTYDYWKIDFSALTAALANYESVAPAGQFTNEDEAVGSELYAAQNMDTTSATPLPEKQTDVENVVNDLNAAMRNLRYKSYNMYIEHKMLNPTGTEVIDNEYIHTYVQTYNKTTTYGAVLDGTANLGDGTYTVKGYHFDPQPDPNFLALGSRHYYQGISSEYTCQEDKDITMIYYADNISDTTLNQKVAEVEAAVDSWDGVYTDMSIDAFVDWYDTRANEGAFSKTYSVFEEEEYLALLAEFNAEYAKLDTIASAEQIDELDQFVMDYEMLSDFSNSFCHSGTVLANYADDYAKANELLDLSRSNNAGHNAANEVLEDLEGFVLQYHTDGVHSIGTTPIDGVDGSYYVRCGNCGDIVDSGVYACPHFNTYKHPAYNYMTRGAGLRIKGGDTPDSDNIQSMRFAASCNVPEDAEVIDFGFVFTQTRYLNGGKEPADNTAINPDQLVEGGLYVNKMSMINGNYSIYDGDGGDVYTFNLVLRLNRSSWNAHYAARSYVVYSINGVEVTVYDTTYSSRAAADIAKQVVANPQELPEVREYIAEKFGL
ncbi:MAG: hypothetical protein IKE65_00740 [Clostridia bacterium]|nr:hypothetical protein [Clostridia bacterium]